MVRRLKCFLGTRLGVETLSPCLYRWSPDRRGVQWGLFLMAAMAYCGLPADRPTRAQDDWDLVERAADQPAARQPELHVSFPQLVKQIFKGRSRSQVEGTLMNRFTLVLSSVERTCELTEPQRKKLELAARGDIGRFFHDIDKLEGEFNEAQGDRRKLNLVFQAMQPLQAKLHSRFFDDDSLLHKVLKTTLDGKQAFEYERQQQKRREFLYRAKIELAVATLETGVPLRDAQRDQFIKLLVNETEPPKKFGEHGHHLVLYQASKVDEAKLKPIFDDAQWRAIEQALEQARGMEEHWRRAGMIP